MDPPPDSPSSTTPDAARRGHGHLRLVRRAGAPILRHVGAIEAVYSSHHRQLLLALDGLEADLAEVDASRCRGASEQISFLRVGLRCLADAVGELHADVADLAHTQTGDSDEHPAGGPA